MGTVMVPVAAFCGDFESERFRPRAESFKSPQKRRKTKNAERDTLGVFC